MFWGEEVCKYSQGYINMENWIEAATCSEHFKSNTETGGATIALTVSPQGCLYFQTDTMCQAPSTMTEETLKSSYIMFQNSRSKSKILKASRWNKSVVYKGLRINSSEFPTATLETGRKQSNVLN